MCATTSAALTSGFSSIAGGNSLARNACGQKASTNATNAVSHECDAIVRAIFYAIVSVSIRNQFGLQHGPLGLPVIAMAMGI